MKILIEGTDKEIKRAKSIIGLNCFAGSEECNDSNMSCEACEVKREFKVEYVIKEQK